MKVHFEFKEYFGEYDDMTGFLTVTNVYTGDVFTKTYATYANKYTAKRGFERIVRNMRAVKKEV